MNLPSMTMMDNLEGPGMILCDGSWQAGVRSEWEVQQDDSSSSEQIHSGLPVSGTKRKATSGGKPSCTGGENKLANTETKSVVKAERTTSEQSGDSKVHPKQDFIHVRARRGQATDSHSLAERVRREKISERMKFLQDLVPGCSKVTGKAVMLDEIINYVQSLQRQIEFLSMKLAAIDPRLDTNLENLLNREVIQESSLMGPDLFSGHRDNYQSHVQLQQQLIDRNMDLRNVGTLCDAYIRRSMQNNSPAAPPALAAYTDSFMDSLAQTISEVSDGELQNIVRMGNVTQARHDFFGQDGVHGPGFLPTGHLKVEY